LRRRAAHDIERLGAIAVAFTLDDVLVVQSRQPAQLYLPGLDQKIDLASDSVADTGHAVFHANAGAGIACASCHLEGGDDGRVWTFDSSGERRTQSLRGGILGTEPFHWDGTRPTSRVSRTTCSRAGWRPVAGEGAARCGRGLGRSHPGARTPRPATRGDRARQDAVQ